MTMSDASWGLPDPNRHSEFYADVLTKRVFAFLIDSVVILVITLLLIPLTAFTAIFFLGFLAFVVSVIYRTVSLANRSATPGMRLMAIEFRTHTGDRFDLKTAFIYTILFSISMSMVLPQIVSVILMLTGQRRQSLVDHLMGTAAINRSAAM